MTSHTQHGRRAPEDHRADDATASRGRRRLLKAAATGLAAAPILAFPNVIRAQSKRRIVATSGGGAYGKAQVEAYFKPFMEETGIEVHATLSGMSLAEKRAQVETGNVTADIVSMGFADVEIMSRNGWLVPIDYGHFRAEDVAGMAPHDRHPYGMGFIYWAEMMAYRTDVFPDGTHPKSWAEFWDTERFPGPRSMGDASYRYSFECPLMAEGVPPAEVYPIDIDRALKGYSRIRDDVVAWWGKSAALPASLASLAAAAQSGALGAPSVTGVTITSRPSMATLTTFRPCDGAATSTWRSPSAERSRSPACRVWPAFGSNTRQAAFERKGLNLACRAGG